MKKIPSRFAKERAIDLHISMSLCFALAMFISSLGAVNFAAAFIMFLALSGISTVIATYLQGSPDTINPWQEAVFKGELQDLVLALYHCEFHLQKKVGGFYIFHSNHFILPTTKVIVIEKDKKCFVQTHKVIMKSFSKYMELEWLEEKNDIKND